MNAVRAIGSGRPRRPRMTAKTWRRLTAFTFEIERDEHATICALPAVAFGTPELSEQPEDVVRAVTVERRRLVTTMAAHVWPLVARVGGLHGCWVTQHPRHGCWVSLYGDECDPTLFVVVPWPLRRDVVKQLRDTLADYAEDR